MSRQMKCGLSFLLSLILSCNIFAQTNKIAALETLIHTAATENERLNYLLALCAEFHSLSPDPPNSFVLQEKGIPKKLNEQHGHRLGGFFMALYFLTAGRSDTSLFLASEQLKT